MTVPKISPLPPPPNRSDQPAHFVARADAYLGAFPTLQTEANAQAEFTNARAADAEAAAQTALSARNASQQAATQATLNGNQQVQLAKAEVQLAKDEVQNAKAEVVLAKAEVTRAQGYANSAEQSHMDAMTAAAAAASGAGLPSLLGNKGRQLLVNESETGVTWGDALKLATQSQATQGTDNVAVMTPLRTKQAIDSQALAYMFGYGQSWQSVTRLINVSYQNATGKPIMISATVFNSGAEAGLSIQASVDNATWVTIASNSSNYSSASVAAIVPAGSFYRVSASSGGFVSSALELR